MLILVCLIGCADCPDGLCDVPVVDDSEAGASRCGDGVCSLGESARYCSRDCGPRALDVDGVAEENVRLPNREVDSFVREHMADNDLVGVGVGVVKDGRLVYLKGYGYQDKEKGTPVLSYRTRFRWASVSKTLTAVVALREAAAGALDLDRHIDNYYTRYETPRLRYNGGFLPVPLMSDERFVSGRMLLNHTAGIPHYSNGWGNPSPDADDTNDPEINTGIEWAINAFINNPLISVPGKEYHYSSFGFNLLGVVLEQATGESFADLVDEHVADTAGLRTLRTDYEWKYIPYRTRGYDADGNDVGSSDVSWKSPGGGFISTVEDFADYCAALTDDTLLTDDMKERAWKETSLGDETSSYGLGFRVGSRNGRAYVEHSGSQQKARTRLRYYPKDDLCIVVMSNSHNASSYDLVRGVEDAARAAIR